jgi:hypothetical protein
MAKRQAVKEKVHLPIYDAFRVGKDAPRNKFATAMTDPHMIRFFVDVENKTKLETNLQAPGILPSLGTFEARAMRVVASTVGPLPAGVNRNAIKCAAGTYCDGLKTEVDLSTLIDTIRPEFSTAMAPARSILADLIYNSVITLLVGEKIMIETPTFLHFAFGVGVSMGNGADTDLGEPDPIATFRFAEPVIIDSQQNFRVEMLFPQGVPGKDGVPGRLAEVQGPFRIWVVLDGLLTRDVKPTATAG